MSVLNYNEEIIKILTSRDWEILLEISSSVYSWKEWVVCEVCYNPGTATWGLSAAPRSRPALTVKNKARLAVHSAQRTFLLSAAAFKWHMHWDWSCSLPPRGCSVFTHTHIHKHTVQKSHLCKNRECRAMNFATPIQ